MPDQVRCSVDSIHSSNPLSLSFQDSLTRNHFLAIWAQEVREESLKLSMLRASYFGEWPWLVFLSAPDIGNFASASKSSSTAVKPWLSELHKTFIDGVSHTGPCPSS